jgi:nucleoside-diphosphate-sugar epimerase
MELTASKVFITGATGLIGGRIAERLWLEQGIAARCLVHNYSGASRLARLPVTMWPGSVLDKASLEQGIGDSKIIFHCAYGNTSDPDLNRQINEDGLRNIGDIALARGIERLIHLSTVAVYGPEPPDYVTEDTPTCFSTDEYGNSKIRTEAICHELSAKGLPVVIIRPTIVFGPFSPIWTIGTIKRVLSGGWENTGDIHGLCNPVYIDDLINGLFLCVQNDSAIGQTFILSGNSPLPWNDYFQAYKALTNLKTDISPASGTSSVWRAYMGHLLRTNIRFLRKFIEPQLIDLYEQLKTTHPAFTRKLYALLSGGIQENEKLKYNQKTVFSIEKAVRLLGYAPRSFEEGMRPTAEWLRYYEYI